MTRSHAFIAAGLALLLVSGCSQDSRPPESGGRLLSRDQVRLLSPADFPGKERAIDALGDFSLSLVPGQPASVEGEGYRLSAPAGCVAQPMTIQAEWLGEGGEIGYNFTPDGQEFLAPLVFELILPLQPADLPAGDDLMVLHDREDGWYEVISNEVHWLSVDEEALLRAPLEHFTKYLIGTGPPPDDGPGTGRR